VSWLDWTTVAIFVSIIAGLGLGPLVARWRRDRAAARRRAELHAVKFPDDDDQSPPRWGG